MELGEITSILAKQGYLTKARISNPLDPSLSHMSYFLPDTGAWASELKGNFISSAEIMTLKELIQVSTKQLETPERVRIANGDLLVGRKTVSLSITPTRSSNAEVIDFTIIPTLSTGMIIGRKTLIDLGWITSNILDGFNPDTSLLASIEDTAILQKCLASETDEENIQKERLAMESYTDNIFDLFDQSEELKEDEWDNEPQQFEEGETPNTIEGTEKFKRSIRDLNERYRQIFSKQLTAKAAKVTPFEIMIDEKGWKKTKESSSPRSQSYSKQAAMRQKTEEGVSSGLFKSSIATHTSAVHMVAKPEQGKYRFTCDYRRLNEYCTKCAFPIPRIKEILGRIATSTKRPLYFATIDLTEGFHQIPLAKISHQFTAFKTFAGVYEYTRMPQGLNGSPQYFQKIMSDIMLGLSGHCVEIYLDDLLVYAESEEELVENLEKVYKRFRETGLIANPRKTKIGLKQLDYLGYTITTEGELLMNEEKRKELFELQRPVQKRQLKAFLGGLTWFGDRIENLQTIAKPLQLLNYTRKKAGEKIIWTQEMLEAWEKLKVKISEIPSLHLIDTTKQIVLRTDASAYGIGAHLLQRPHPKVINGKIIEPRKEEEETIQFISKSFDDTQLKWGVGEKEGYAIFYAAKKLQYLIDGIPVIVETDHRNFTTLQESENPKICRWKNLLQRLDLKYKYIPGELNEVADALSRMAGIKDNNKDFVNRTESLLYVLGETNKKIDNSSTMGIDESRINTLRTIASEELENELPQEEKEEPGKGDTLSENTWTKEEKGAYLVSMIRTVHNFSEGHFGINKTKNLVSKLLEEWKDEDKESIRNSLFSNRDKEKAVRAFINNCPICQKRKSKGNEQIKTTPFTNSTYKPMERVQVDHIGPFQEDDRGNNHILVVIDTFSRWIELYPVKDVSFHTTAFNMLDYFTRYGAPKELRSDKGSAFTDAVFKEMCTLAKCDLSQPNAGSKEETGIVERVNREIRKHLTDLMKEKFMQKEWSIAVKFTQRILNNSIHSITGEAPARLVHGHLIDSPLATFRPEEQDTRKLQPQQYLHNLTETQDNIIKNIKEKLECIDAKNLEEREKDQPILETSTLVLYKNPKKTKSDTEYIGPFLVTNKDRDFYELTSLTKDMKPFMVHARSIKRYLLNNDYTPLEVALMDNNKYPIHAIQGHTDENGYLNKSFDCRYEKAPNDPQWKNYKEIKFEKAFVEYCYRVGYFGWIDKHNSRIHPELIANLEEKRKENQIKLVKENEEKKRKKQENLEKNLKPQKKRKIEKEKKKRAPAKRAQPQQQRGTKKEVISRSGRTSKANRRFNNE